MEAAASDQPLYGASFLEAQRRFWRKYLIFRGRASLSEFWWWMAGYVGIGLLLSAANRAVVSPPGPSPSGHAVLGYSVRTGIASTAWSVVNFVGGSAVTVRRLHDTGRSGWWWFVQLLVGIGSIVLVVLVALPSRSDGRRFD